jgi:hypothetical protein
MKLHRKSNETTISINSKHIKEIPMKTRLFFLNALMIALFVTAFSTLASAQSTRTWVSGVGDDVNPCSRTAPCKTFSGTISKTAAGGEINAIDPGGYGTITITKSITIDGAGTHASILAAGFTGVTINAGANDVVTLRNLSINGAGTGVNGIRILNAKAVFIENCVIFGFTGSSATTGRGITDERTTAGSNNLFVTNTTIRNNTQSNIVISPGTGSVVNAALTNVVLERSTANSGLAVQKNANVLIRNSVISGNFNFGIVAEETEGSVDINVENCTVTNNGTGVSIFSGAPVVRISNTMVTGNSTGLSGSIVSFGNNRIAGNNAGNGPPAGGNIGQQ